MRPTILNPPNLITLLRFVLVPVTAVQIVEGRDAVAFWLLLIALASDAADGFVARRWDMRTAFGAAADPLADKAMLLTVIVLLAWQDALPWWFALVVAARDAMIVLGVLAYRFLIGPVETAPSLISKANTALEFLLVLAVIAVRAQWLPGGAWLALLLAATLGTVVVSGGLYVVTGTRMAWVARHGMRSRR
jgi:cardiolipin synthase